MIIYILYDLLPLMCVALSVTLVVLPFSDVLFRKAHFFFFFFLYFIKTGSTSYLDNVFVFALISEIHNLAKWLLQIFKKNKNTFMIR